VAAAVKLAKAAQVKVAEAKVARQAA